MPLSSAKAGPNRRWPPARGFQASHDKEVRPTRDGGRVPAYIRRREQRMGELERIWLFLRVVRARARRETALRRTAWAVAFTCAVLAILAATAASVGPAGFWPAVTTGVLLAVTATALLIAWWLPAWRLRPPEAVARLVGTRSPAVASDLLSAVELAQDARQLPDGADRASPGLTNAFFATVADRCATLDPRQLVPFRRARVAAASAAVAVIGFAALLSAGPVRKGAAVLLRKPTRFEGAAVSSEPLVADVRVIYEYPPYTKLPARTVDGSSGDVAAVKGTQVTLRMRPLRSARKAMLLLGAEGEAGETPATVANGELVVRFPMVASGVYRVWLAPLIGRPVREMRAHRIDVEADRPPQVEIYGPADRLEIPAPRPIEVAFAANDDFGLDVIDLVYRVDEAPEQRVRLRDAAGARTAQGKTVWTPSLGNAGPGSRVAYHIEAADTDAVSGAKRASSRVLYVIIDRPRENFDERMAREREILERLIEGLADRLELAHGGVTGGPTTGLDAIERVSGWQRTHEAEEAHVATLGRLIDEERRAGSASKNLLGSLAGIADRLGKLLREETPLLTALRDRAAGGALPPSALAPLLAAGVRHVDELERAVLLLDDLIGRQRLEDLADVGRELTDAYKRLEDLLARYQATKDEALRRQLEREIRDLRTRLSELAQKIAELKGRNDVATEWQNVPDLSEAAEKVRKLDSLLDKGDTSSLSKALAELGQSLASIKNMLDKNADEFADERFPQERKAMSELAKKVGDLEGDQRALAGDTGTLAAELEQELKRRAGQEVQQKLDELKQKAAALASKTRGTPPRGLGETAQDELGQARESAERIQRLLARDDLSEARAEADRAATSLDKVERGAKRQAGRSSTSAPLEGFASEMGQAKSMAGELRDALASLMPAEGEVATPGQRERAKGLSDRQSALEKRTRELGEEMAKKAGQFPGMERASGELGGAADQMARAQSQLGRGSPREATGSEREAAEKLARLRNSMGNNGGQRGEQGMRHKDPVRIPGADDTQAPREWRHELMEAMREKAPERFKEEVRRYYEELVK